MSKKLEREFFAVEPVAAVLVDTGPQFSIAKAGEGPNVLAALQNVAGREVRPVFSAETFKTAGMIPASRGSIESSVAARFVEVGAKDVPEATALAAKIQKELKGQIAAALPVPAAVPALGPGYAEPTPAH